MKLWEENGYLFIDGTDAEKLRLLEVFREDTENPKLTWNDLYESEVTE